MPESVDLEREFSNLIWTGRSSGLVDQPAVSEATWVGSVQADMLHHKAAGFVLTQPNGPLTPSKRVCMIMMARDEVDILSTNVLWHYAAGLRRMIISDNGSIDGSLRKLFELRDKLSDAEIIILSDPIERYMQAEKMTGLFKLATQVWPDCRWVFPLDADEFLVPTQGLSVLDYIHEADGVVVCKTNHFLDQFRDRVAGDPPATTAMPYRHPFGLQPPKVALRSRPEFGLSQGNHFITAPSPAVMTGGLKLGIYIREFQIRSFLQFHRRVANGGQAVLRAEQHLGHPVGGDHWKAWHKVLQESGDAGLMSIFTSQFVRPTDIELIHDPFDISYI